MYGTRVVIACKKTTTIKQIKSMMNKAGYLVIGEATDGQRALQLIRTTQPDLVLVDLTLPSLSGGELAQNIEDAGLAPVLVLVSPTERSIAREAIHSKIYSYALFPIDEGGLLAAIDSAMANFRRIGQMAQEISKLRDQLESRKVVEKAKGLLMKQFNLKEEEAFRKMQKQSMDKRTSMAAIAKAIILSYELQQ